MENNTFKSAVFGGFRRGDVVAYIEKSASEANARISALEESEDRLSRENEALRGDLASVTGARDRLSDALSDNFDRQEALQAALNEANAEIASLRALVLELTGQRDALQSEADTLRPQAEEYNAVKANLAELELAAHRRADDYEAEARRRADVLEQGTRARLREMLGACRAQCELVMSTLATTCENVSEELRRSTESVLRLPDAFHTLRHDLENLNKLE